MRKIVRHGDKAPVGYGFVCTRTDGRTKVAVYVPMPLNLVGRGVLAIGRALARMYRWMKHG